MEEIWKDVDGYEGLYQVSNLGRVKSLERVVSNGKATRIVRERIRIQCNSFGYKIVCLAKKSRVRPLRVHRLIASAFIPNPESKPHINHKNGIRDDNRIENLEWCTHQENITHCFRVLKRKKGGLGLKGALSSLSKPVMQYTKSGEFIKEWDSATTAGVELGIARANIISCRNFKLKSAGGFVWRFK